MKRTDWILLWISSIVFFGSPPSAFSAEQPQKQHCVIEKLVMARDVQDHEPVDEGTEFDAVLGKLYCWMKVQCPAPPTRIKHVWYRGEPTAFQITLDIKYAAMRTWSVKGITAGDWRVDVVDEADQVIGSVSFQIK